jgi:hypothetical protein
MKISKPGKPQCDIDSPKEPTIEWIKCIIEESYDGFGGFGGPFIFEVLKEIYPGNLPDLDRRYEGGWQIQTRLLGYEMRSYGTPISRSKIQELPNKPGPDPTEDDVRREVVKKIVYNTTFALNNFSTEHPKRGIEGKKTCRADYAIFEGEHLFAIIEVKKEKKIGDGFFQLYQYVKASLRTNSTPMGILTDGKSYVKISLKSRGFEAEFMPFEVLFRDKMRTQEHTKTALAASAGP